MECQQKCLIIYDGVCKLCNWWVRFLIARDSADCFRFFPFQELRSEQLPQSMDGRMSDSVIVYWDGEYFQKSEGVIRILKCLPAPWRYLVFIRFIPIKISNSLYDVIARFRYRLFGTHRACPLVPPAYRAKYPDPDRWDEFL